MKKAGHRYSKMNRRLSFGRMAVRTFLPEFMEEYEMTEERAREVLLDALPEEESEVVCFSSEQNAESFDSNEMQKADG